MRYFIKNLFLPVLSFLFVFTNCKKDKERLISPIQCEIADLSIETGDCTSDSTYQLIINFEVIAPQNDLFDIYIRNNQLIGTFKLSELPLTIEDFPKSFRAEDFLKICINDTPDCCKELEWLPPNCDGTQTPCNLYDLELEIGDCCADDSEFYELNINFKYSNPGNDFFEIFVRNNELIGTYKLDKLPITIPKFPKSGNPYDFIKICINDQPNCCIVEEYLSPNCSDSGCEIENLNVSIGDCTCEDAYNLVIDFDINNSTSDYFDLYIRNNEYLGSYKINQLPITIENFPKSGSTEDFIQIVLSNQSDCGAVLEFPSPDCDNHNSDCEISNMTERIGDCTSDETYNLWLNFDHNNADNDYFDLFVRNGEFIGFFRLDELPLKLENFEMSGFDYDYLKVCINDNNDCCREIEFMPPNCDDSQTDCNISDIIIEVGDCTSDNTYNLWLDFEFENPGNDEFNLYTRNREFIGTFRLDQLPLKLEDFEKSGRDYDFLRICIDGSPNCCEEIEWMSLDC